MSKKMSLSGRKVVDIRHPSWCRRPRRQSRAASFQSATSCRWECPPSGGIDMRVMPEPAFAGRSCDGRTLCGPRQLPTFFACALRLHHTQGTRTPRAGCSRPASSRTNAHAVERRLLQPPGGAWGMSGRHGHGMIRPSQAGVMSLSWPSCLCP